MSTTVDERVVSMRFDNKDFEQNVRTSMSTLEKLKQALNLGDSAKGLSGLSNAAKNVRMDGLADGIETVQARFSALQVIGTTALANITNSVVNTGKKIASALTVEPVHQGFEEYELKLNSVQTIMNSSGASMEKVSSVLNKLNTYADQTIYSFSDMTSSIGKFTNAGVKLDDAVEAIKGIANAAAFAGSSTQQANSAMYNFAQTMSTGYLNLMDYKSIELAGMGTKQFRQELIKTAVEMGTLQKVGKGMYESLTTNAKGKTSDAFGWKNVRDNLQYQWATTDVVVETLKKYTDTETELGRNATKAATQIKSLTQMFDVLKEEAGSGWAQSWELVFGNFEEAKTLFTEVGTAAQNLIGKMSNARNEILQDWKDLGGRDSLIQSLRNVMGGVTSVIAPVKKSFSELFPTITGKRLFQYTKNLENLTAKLHLSDKTSKNLANTVKIFLGPLKTTSVIFGELAKTGYTVAGSFLKMTSIISGKALEKMSLFSWDFGKGLRKLNKEIKKFKLSKKVGKGLDEFGTYLKESAKGVSEFITEAKKLSGVKRLFDIFTNIKNSVSSKIFSGFGSSLKTLSGGLSGIKLPKFDKDKSLKTLNKYLLLLIETGTKFKNNFGTAIDSVRQKLQLLKSGFSSTNQVTGSFGSAIPQANKHTNAFIDGITKLIKTLGLMKDSLVNGYKNFKEDNPFKHMADTIQEVIKVIDGFMEGVDFDAIIQNFKTLGGEVVKYLDNIKDSLTVGKVATIVYAAVLIKTISQVGNAIEKIGNAFQGINTLTTSINNLLKVKTKASLFKDVAIGVGILAASLLMLSDVPLEKLAVAGGALLVMSFAIFLFTRATSELAKVDITMSALSIIALSTAVLELAAAMKIISTIDIPLEDKAIVAFASKVGALAILVGVFGFVAAQMAIYAPKLSVGSLFLLAFAGSVYILSKALVEIADPSLAKNIDESMRTIAAIAISIGALGIAASKIKITSSIGLFIMVEALKSFKEILSDTSIQVSGKQLAATIGVFMVVAVALTVFGRVIGQLAIDIGKAIRDVGVGVLGFGAAVALIAIGIRTFGEVLQTTDLSDIVVGMAGIFVGIVAVSRLAGEASKNFGVGILAFSAGVVILTFAVSLLGDLELSQVTNGLLVVGGVGVVLGVLVALSGLASNAYKSIIAVTVAFTALLGVTAILSLIPWKQLAPAAGAVAGILLGLAAAMAAMKNVNTKGIIGMVAMMVSLVAIVPVFKLLSTIPFDDLMKVCITIAASLTILGIATKALTNNVQGTVALISMAGALLLLAVGIKAMASVGLQEFIISLLGFAAAMAVFAGISMLLLPASAAMYAVSGAILVFGASVAAIGAGILLVAKGIETLINVFTGGSSKVAESSKEYQNAGSDISNSVAEGVTSNKDKVSDAVNEVKEEAKAGVESDGSEFYGDGAAWVGEIAGGIGDSSSLIDAQTGKINKAAIAELMSNNPNMSDSGSGWMKYLGTGELSQIGSVKNAATTVGKSAINGLDSMKGSFQSTGGFCVSGFIKGILSKLKAAYQAGASVTKNADQGARDAVKIKSPSRTFAEVAMYCIKGFTNYMNANAYQAYNSAHDLGDEVISGFSGVLTALDNINDEINPVISPIIDLDNVNSGINRIDGMLSSRTLSIGANVDGNLRHISNLMTNRQNGLDDTRIVGALNNLSRDIKENPRTINTINGMTYNDSDNINNAVGEIITAARLQGRM